MFRRPVPPGGFKPASPAEIPPVTPLLISEIQMRRLHAIGREVGVDHDLLRSLATVIQPELTSLKTLTVDGFRHLMVFLERSYGAKIEAHERAPVVASATPTTARQTPVVSGLVALQNGGDVVAAVANHRSPPVVYPTPASDKFQARSKKPGDREDTWETITDEDVRIEWAGVKRMVAASQGRLFYKREWNGKLTESHTGDFVFTRASNGKEYCIADLGSLQIMQIPF